MRGMAVRKIELLGSQVLRTPARRVEDFGEDLQDLVRDMFDTMYHAEGVGLAGPQIGVSLRVLVLDVSQVDDSGRDSEYGRRPFALVNPEVVEASPTTDRVPEGCLSIPGVSEVVTRPVAVTVEANDPRGEPIRVEATGFLARALQHEIDHLDGILFIDHLSPLKRRMLLKKWRKLQREAETGAGG